MTDAELRKLNVATEVCHRAWVERGKRLTYYRCTHCAERIECRCPDPKDVSEKGYWDASTTCLECGEINFVTTYPDGHTTAIGIDLGAPCNA